MFTIHIDPVSLHLLHKTRVGPLHTVFNRRAATSNVYYYTSPVNPFTSSAHAIGLDSCCSVYSLHGKLYSIHCKLYCLRCKLYSIRCKLYSIRCKLYSIGCKLYSIRCKLYSIRCKLYSIRCKLYSIRCKLYSVHCKLYSAHSRAQNLRQITVKKPSIGNQVSRKGQGKGN